MSIVEQAEQSVSIVVLTWNSLSVIEQCLRSANAQRPYEIIVLDNGSEDGTPDLVERVFPHVRLLRQSTNLGFASEADYTKCLLDVMRRERRVASCAGKLLKPGSVPPRKTPRVLLFAATRCHQWT